MAFFVHMSVPPHVTACCSISLWRLPSLFFSSLMEEQQNVRLPLGTTEWNHSYCTGNSLSTLHSLQQLHAGASTPPPAQMSGSTRVSHGAAPSNSVSCPQVTLSATPPTLSQVTFCQLRSLRLPRSSPLLHSWSVEFLFVLLRRPSNQSPPHLCMPLRRLFHTSPPLGTFLRTSHSGSSWLHPLRMTFSALRVLDQSPRYLLIRLCRRPYTASQLMMPPHNFRSRSSSSGTSCPMTL